MTRQYIQQLAAKLVVKYRNEVRACPDYKPAARLYDAANALDQLVNHGDSRSLKQVIGTLELAKNDGTAGHELWLAGTNWSNHQNEVE